ncbi:uncharacterized protein BDW70DRAFT_6799 [Aspergillus foveolatus]|uniref:uncharacterized protein n=1 Tax=Aspergillus foveolatus TaxID=210207 RepID=UPI003CCE2FCD
MAGLRGKSYSHYLSKYLANLLYCTHEPKNEIGDCRPARACNQATTKQYTGVMWPGRRTEECEERSPLIQGLHQALSGRQLLHARFRERVGPGAWADVRSQNEHNSPAPRSNSNTGQPPGLHELIQRQHHDHPGSYGWGFPTWWKADLPKPSLRLEQGDAENDVCGLFGS